MSMQAQHYSLSALDAELGPTARTWAKYLQDVEPSKVQGKTKYYRLADAIKAIPPHLLGIVGTTTDGEDLDLNQQSARLKKWQADKAKREVGKMDGDLLPGDQTEAAWADQVVAFRAKMMAVPGRIAVRVVGMDAREMEDEIEVLIHDALRALVDEFGTRSAGGTDSHTGEAGRRHGGPAPEADGKRVGGRKSGSKQRGKRRTRKVADGPGPVSAGHDGRTR